MGRTRTTIGLLLLVSAIAGCGGDGSSDPGSTVTSAAGDGSSSQAVPGDTEDLVEAARAHFEAFLTRDDETYFDLLSAACRERLGFAAVGGHIDGRYFTAGLDGVDMTELSVADVVVEGGNGSTMVSLVIDGPSGDQFREALPQSWVYEDDGWHMDDCADFREAQGGLEGVGMGRSSPLRLGGVADVNSWLVALMHISLDSEEMIVETGGEPADEGTQLFTVQLNVGYNGGESSVVYGDELEFAMVNGDNVYGDESDCIAPGNDLYVDPATTVGPGEDVGVPFVCREVPSDQVTGMLLRVTHVPTGDEWWFTLDGQ